MVKEENDQIGLWTTSCKSKTYRPSINLLRQSTFHLSKSKSGKKKLISFIAFSGESENKQDYYKNGIIIKKIQ